MSTDIPRRLPPTPEERLKVISTRMAGGSNVGSTRWAQPVTKTSNYSPVNAVNPAPTTDTGVYLTALDTGNSLEPAGNDDYQPDDGRLSVYDQVTISVTLPTPNSQFLIESFACIFVDRPSGAESGDGIEFYWLTSGTQDGGSQCTYTPSAPTRAILTGAQELSPLIEVPPTLDGQTLPTTSIYMTWIVNTAVDVGEGALIQLVGRAIGPPMLVMGGHWLRASYIGPVIGIT